MAPKQRITTLLLASGFALGSISCTTTGDPRSGGLWGWSEQGAQQRVQQKAGQIWQTHDQYKGLKGYNQSLQRKAY